MKLSNAMLQKKENTKMAKTVADVLKLGKDVKMVDVRFIDLPGTWQHFTIPVRRLDEELFAEGLPFDGSSIRGFQEIHESDMLLMPDPESAFIDPVADIPTLVITCDVYDPITLQPYDRDPRYVARKAEAYVKQTGIADTVFFGPEAEFFIFDNVRYGSNTNESFYHIDSDEGWWNSGRSDRQNFGGQISPKRGFPCPTYRHAGDARRNVALERRHPMEVHHHDGNRRSRIAALHHTHCMLTSFWFAHIAKNVARKNGNIVTFMPKPCLRHDPVCTSTVLVKGDTNVFTMRQARVCHSR
jgi:glutamine synthetase